MDAMDAELQAWFDRLNAILARHSEANQIQFQRLGTTMERRLEAIEQELRDRFASLGERLATARLSTEQSARRVEYALEGLRADLGRLNNRILALERSLQRVNDHIRFTTVPRT
jgi:hypothetical protein